MIQFFDFSLSDFIFLIIKLAIAAVVLRWFLGLIHETFFPNLFRRNKAKTAKNLEDAKPKRRVVIKHTGPKLRVEKVFHIGAPDGRIEIVVASEEEEAKRVGAASLGVSEEDVVSSEVYDKVVRK